MADIPHVAILVETSREYGRGVLRGIKQFLVKHGPWSVFVERRSLNSPVPGWLRKWRGDGILTRSESQAMVDAVRNVHVPVVELRPSGKLDNPFPVIRTNDVAVGRMAAEHLLECRFKRFGCVLQETRLAHPQFRDRHDGFVAAIESAGLCVDTHSYFSPGEASTDWERQQNRLVEWVAKLMKPVGVLATTDQIGFWLLDACERARISVPDDVAVVGVENDAVLCSLTNPPLSSVRLHTEQVGFQAAELLGRLMAGERSSGDTTFVDPLGVVVRQSSDIVAVSDAQMASALRYIRLNACSGILSVEEVSRAVHMSRSSLERRMRTELNRSPMAEIRRVQLGRVKELLLETDLPLTSIAEKSGFAYPQYMNEVFKKAYGEPPGAYRETHRSDKIAEALRRKS